MPRIYQYEITARGRHRHEIRKLLAKAKLDGDIAEYEEARGWFTSTFFARGMKAAFAEALEIADLRRSGVHPLAMNQMASNILAKYRNQDAMMSDLSGYATPIYK